MYVRTYVRTYVRMYVCTYTYVRTYVCMYQLDVMDKLCMYIGAFGKVFRGKFTDEDDETVIEVAVKTMKG